MVNSSSQGMAALSFRCHLREKPKPLSPLEGVTLNGKIRQNEADGY